jgi:hypothetical protein
MRTSRNFSLSACMVHRWNRAELISAPWTVISWFSGGELVELIMGTVKDKTASPLDKSDSNEWSRLLPLARVGAG